MEPSQHPAAQHMLHLRLSRLKKEPEVLYPERKKKNHPEVSFSWVLQMDTPVLQLGTHEGAAACDARCALG